MVESSQICFVAACGLIAASTTSAFVASLPHPQLEREFASSHLRSLTGHSHLGATKKVSISDASIKKDLLLLNQGKFLEDMETSLSNLPTDAGAAMISHSPWRYRGHDVFCRVAMPTEKRPGAPAILLVHGFGCSTTCWRETARALAGEGYEVHAMDLLGQGLSAKPTEGVEYSINLWAQQVDAYARDNLEGKDVVLVGNSIGSLVSLTAATGDFAESAECYIRNHVVGIGMFNCGIGMNTRNILKDSKWNSVQKYMFSLVFDVMETLVFGNIEMLTWIMDTVITRDLLSVVLKELYKCAVNPDAKVNDELVDSFYLPAKQAETIQVLRQFLTDNSGLTPIELHAKHGAFLKTLPIHVMWGADDTVVPLQWQVGQFYSNLSAMEGNAVTMDVVHGGHMLFDEVPDVANGRMLSWLNEETTRKISMRN